MKPQTSLEIQLRHILISKPDSLYIKQLCSIFKSVAHVVVLADDVLGERDVSRTAGLQRYGVRPEVLQHVVHVREPEVLHAALASLAQRHAEVLSTTLNINITINFNHGWFYIFVFSNIDVTKM